MNTQNPVGSAKSGTLTLNGVTVVCARTGKLTPNTDVAVENGVIRSIGSGAGQQNPQARSIDARGKFLVPGFFDMHVHSMQQPNPADNLMIMLAHGITGVRQMAGSPELLEKRKKGELDFGPETPELLAMPGAILAGGNAATPEAAVEEVKKQKAQGADFIKTIAVSPKAFFASLEESKRQGLPYGGHVSPGVDIVKASKRGMNFIEHLGPTELALIRCSSAELVIRTILALRPPPPFNLSEEELRGKKTQMLVANPSLFRLQIDPGSMSKTKRLVSSYKEGKSRALAALFAENDTWQCPTLIRNETMAFGHDPRFTQAPELRYVPAEVRSLWDEVAVEYASKLKPEDQDTLKRLMDLSFRLVKDFDDAGVKMMAGTDYGGGWVIPGVSLHQEFDLLEKCGLSPLRVLQMTTISGAEFLGIENRCGTVEEGKDGNFVLLDADPIESIQNLHTVAGVVRNGNYYSKDELASILLQVEKKLASGGVN